MQNSPELINLVEFLLNNKNCSQSSKILNNDEIVYI